MKMPPTTSMVLGRFTTALTEGPLDACHEGDPDSGSHDDDDRHEEPCSTVAEIQIGHEPRSYSRNDSQQDREDPGITCWRGIDRREVNRAHDGRGDEHPPGTRTRHEERDHDRIAHSGSAHSHHVRLGHDECGRDRNHAYR